MKVYSRQSLKDKFSNFLSATQNFCVTICLFCIMKHINEAYYGRIIPQLFCYKRGPHAKNSKKVLPNHFLLHIFAINKLLNIIFFMEIKYFVEKKKPRFLFFGCFAVCCKRVNAIAKGIL